mmetsp:Transcript_28529/g.55516  ORF Transcript_28529/g.55516 Transcript_28529/m.55516 type:complete len:233 (-) Transcript_28529:635-1333(-)
MRLTTSGLFCRVLVSRCRSVDPRVDLSAFASTSLVARTNGSRSSGSGSPSPLSFLSPAPAAAATAAWGVDDGAPGACAAARVAWAAEDASGGSDACAMVGSQTRSSRGSGSSHTSASSELTRGTGRTNSGAKLHESNEPRDATMSPVRVGDASAERPRRPLAGIALALSDFLCGCAGSKIELRKLWARNPHRSPGDTLSFNTFWVFVNWAGRVVGKEWTARRMLPHSLLSSL